MPRGASSPLFYLRHFFAWFLTLVPRSLLLNRTETLAAQAVADGESSVALYHGVASGGYGLLVALKKKEIGLGPIERCHSVPRCGVKKKGSIEDRESSVALGHRVALKKKKLNDRSRPERAVSLCATGWR